MTYRVFIEVDFDDKDTAVKALSDMEEVAGKANGDLHWSEIENLDTEEVL